MNLKARYGQTYRIAREEGTIAPALSDRGHRFDDLRHVVGCRGHVVNSNQPRGSSEWGGRPINIGRPRPPARCGRPRGETDQVGIESPGGRSLASLTRGHAATHEPSRPTGDAHQRKRGAMVALVNG